jgi:YHS domain-containing protein
MTQVTGRVATAARTWRGRLRAGLRFTRHYVEMVVAMFLGMAVMGGAIALLGRPPGYDTTLGLYAYMGLAMSAPMVAWMRRMGHPWSDCWEMTASMVAPMFALVVPFALGLLPMTAMGVMMWAHAAMLGGMLLLMLHRWDVYANGAHCHHGHTPVTGAGLATDPVCGMAVDPATARSAAHAGTTYHFCSPGCRTAFTAEPATYLAADYVPSM